jgi:hypothetical protein
MDRQSPPGVQMFTSDALLAQAREYLRLGKEKMAKSH